MATSEQQCTDKFHAKKEEEEEEEEEDYGTENGESDVESNDSDNDPTFDVLEETRSRFSNLSIKRKTKSRVVTKDQDMGSEIDPDEVEIVVPELDEKDKTSFENVLKIIQAGQLQKLKVDQCKVYLRKYGLRLTGNKDTLIQRIKEHIEILDGGGEKKYPIYSFVMNCKGDACTGDVVMFEQNVYDMYNIASRSATGPPCGTRIVAGRIVKESYGAAKQQHTFSVEVLWSKGEKALPPLHPLLIKGRNLYRLKTLRQKWEDEGERRKVLLEKHSRGFLARSDREGRMQEKEMRKRFKTNRVPKELSKNKVPVKPNSANDSKNLVLQQPQQKQLLQNHHQYQISQLQHSKVVANTSQSYPIMNASCNTSLRKENIEPPQTLSQSYPIMTASCKSSLWKENNEPPQTSNKFSDNSSSIVNSCSDENIQNIQHPRQPLTSLNRSPPPLTIRSHYPSLSPTHKQTSHHSMNQRHHQQNQMQRQREHYQNHSPLSPTHRQASHHSMDERHHQQGQMQRQREPYQNHSPLSPTHRHISLNSMNERHHQQGQMQRQREHYQNHSPLNPTHRQISHHSINERHHQLGQMQRQREPYQNKSPMSPKHRQTSHHSMNQRHHQQSQMQRQQEPYQYQCPSSPTHRQVSNHSMNQRHHQHSQMQRQPCRYYAQGRCYYGDNCKFMHE